jgi:hypothetical protein
MMLADLVSEFTGTFERHHPSFIQYQVFSGGWIPSLSGRMTPPQVVK